MEQDHGAEVKRLHDTIRDYEKRIEAIVEELNILQNAKLSLEVEIMMYRKLLECEEKKYDNLFIHLFFFLSSPFSFSHESCY